MNTTELRPIDARTMKPGGRCVDRDGLECCMLVYDPSGPLPHEHAAIRMACGCLIGTTFDGRYTSDGAHQFFLPPDPDPVDPSPGNVDKLRKSQVGEGWRIPAHDEQPDKRARVWLRDGEVWAQRTMDGAYQRTATYRVPIEPIRMVPLEMKDFVGKPWPLVLVCETSRVMLGLNVSGVEVAGLGFVAFSSLREHYTISWDHGVTWVKAEKEEQA